MSPSGIRNVINPQCYRNFARSCVMYIPDWLGRYVLHNIDTIPKLLDHVLILMAVCNFFCIISARKIAHLSAFAAFLLGFQNAVLLWVLKGNNASRQHQRPGGNGLLFLPPTEFMIGVCLGITVGGTILSFFLCLMYGKSHEFCDELIHMANTYNNNGNSNTPSSTNNNTTTTYGNDDDDSTSTSTYVSFCLEWKGAIDGVWWWSSCVFWLNLFSCILIAAGRHEIANNNNSGMNAQYETIMDNSNDDNDDNNMNPNNQDQFQQYKQQQHQSQQQATFSGNYNNIPDINHPGQQPVPQQQQQQSMMSHQNSIPPRHHQQHDPLLV